MEMLEGNSSYGSIVYSIDGTKVRRGDGGSVVYLIDGDKIRNDFGSILFTID